MDTITKNSHPDWDDCFFGAASQIRTGDLILTKDALYLLSYSSKSQTALPLYRRVSELSSLFLKNVAIWLRHFPAPETIKDLPVSRQVLVIN